MPITHIEHFFIPGTLECSHTVINGSLIIPAGPKPTKEEMAPLLEAINKEILQSVYEAAK